MSGIEGDWSKPAAMAIPKEGYFELERGRYGPLFPRTPACYGFSIIAKVKEGREETVRAYGKTIEETIANSPEALAPLRLHYLRWVLFDVGSGLHFQYQGIFDTDFDKYTEDAVALFSATGITTVFTNLEGFPEDWKENPEAFIEFVREHQCPSFLEYGEYPYVTADEIKEGAAPEGGLLRHARPDAMTSTPLAAVGQYIDAFNNGDPEVMAATFDSPGSILDGMAPHLWQGPTATEDWYRDVLAEGELHDASGYFVTLDQPLHENVTGDSAYVVVPATMTFTVDGKKVTQTGAVFTVALRQRPEGWRIAAWAWTKGEQ